MPKTKLATALAALLVLAAPAVAQAGKIKHRGTITDVPGTYVKFTVKKKNGELKSITNMSFIDIPVTCNEGSSGPLRLDVSSFPVSGKDFIRKGQFGGPDIEDGLLRLSGRFFKGGKRASGEVRASFQSPSGAACGTDDLAWTTRKNGLGPAVTQG